MVQATVSCTLLALPVSLAAQTVEEVAAPTRPTASDATDDPSLPMPEEATPPSANRETGEGEPGLPPAIAPPAFFAEPLEPAPPTETAATSQPLPEEELGAPPPLARTRPPKQRVHLVVPEPPPPPIPRHRAPRTALVAGLRLGYWLPFGDLWGRCVAADAYGCTHVQSVPFRDYAGQGPMFELDVGARLARHYTLYALFEHARLGPASGEPLVASGKQSESETDFFALGFRVSTNPNSAGLLLDLAIGARRFRTIWNNGAELRLSDAPFESRLGIGADIRLSRSFSLSPMFTVGVGSFAQADWVDSDDTIREATPEGASRMTHGWLTLQLGAHFDLFAKR